MNVGSACDLKFRAYFGFLIPITFCTVDRAERLPLRYESVDFIYSNAWQTDWSRCIVEGE